MRPDFILFDLDGTLSDPLEGIANCMNHALVHFGYPARSQSELSRYVGPPIDINFAKETGSKDPAHIAALIERYRERYAIYGHLENRLYGEVPAMLAGLAEEGIPMAVCTSKRRDFAEKILVHFDLQDYFQFVDGGDIGVQKWQQIAAMRAANKVPENTLMVGDRGVDMIAAHRNGLTAAGVLWGYGSLDELAAHKPRFLFDQPGQLLAALRQTETV
ncbi:phosphoglycolate phosphatase [Silvimonas terrae]|uniref:Phosphoglycolate phosphatase n=1 Tax=Silvimonas terrae TaxID=300266 RepID=A0A840RKW0_9NEIS|nr:HAD hydrolase-like protein [Silvimonas terrae]MBB5192936.1 phosphoglycolate phosphatase [Silvimonas terrae]